VSNFWRDLRLAARILAKAPVFAIAAVLTLALCMGANTAIFSVIDSVLLRGLPYPHAERLASVETLYRGHGTQDLEDSQDGKTWFLVRQHAPDLEPAAYGLPSGVNFAIGEHAEYVQQQRVSAGYFKALGVAPLLGRTFTEDEDRPGGAAVAMLSYDFWKRALGGRRDVVGGTIMLKGAPQMVVGVMPRGFRSEIGYGGEVSSKADLWAPLRPSTTGEGEGSNYSIVARLKPGVTWPQAEAEIEAVGASRFGTEHLPAGVTAKLTLVPLQQDLTAGVRVPLLFLWGAVGLLLLIGCVNVSGLLFARAQTRTREMATRLALGARRSDVIRQLLAESCMLACLGGALGLALAWAALDGLSRLMEEGFGISQTATLDGRVLAASAGATILTVFIFGLWPAWQAGRTDMRGAIAESGTTVAGPRSRWPRRTLLLAEFALSFLLLVAAGLLLRTFADMRGLKPGFDAHHVEVASFSLQDARYATAAAMNRLFNETLLRLRHTPGVDSAAVSLSLPYQRPLNMGVTFAGRPTDYHQTNLTYVTPDYFSTLRIPILRGRPPADSDTANSEKIALVNRAFAERYFGGKNPVGEQIRLDNRALDVIGMAGDVQEKEDFGNFGATKTMPMVFIPAAQTPDDLMGVHIWFSPNLIVRSALPASTVARDIRDAIAASDPLMPVAKLTDMEAVEALAFAGEHAESLLVGLMAALALALAAVGIYGAIASSVVERTREIGIRMALGATRAGAVGELSRAGVFIGLGGIAIGLAAALPLVTAMRSLLYGVQPRDPATFAAAGGVLLATAAVASLIPAWRVARMNPAATLRNA
jgi:predicted permease